MMTRIGEQTSPCSEETYIYKKICGISNQLTGQHGLQALELNNEAIQTVLEEFPKDSVNRTEEVDDSLKWWSRLVMNIQKNNPELKVSQGYTARACLQSKREKKEKKKQK